MIWLGRWVEALGAVRAEGASALPVLKVGGTRLEWNSPVAPPSLRWCLRLTEGVKVPVSGLPTHTRGRGPPVLEPCPQAPSEEGCVRTGGSPTAPAPPAEPKHVYLRGVIFGFSESLQF